VSPRASGDRLTRRYRRNSLTKHPRPWNARLIAPEQVAIAAAHAANRISDQTNNLGATRRCQPFAAGLAADKRVKQHGGYLAIACMLLPAVQRTEHQDQPSPLLSGERRDRRRRRSGQAQPEMQCGFDALRHMRVKGNNGCKRCSRWGISKHPKLAVAAGAQQDMAAVRPAGDKCCRR
jgi:hypothetical protein